MFRKLSNVFMRVVLTVSAYLVDTWARFFRLPVYEQHDQISEHSRLQCVGGRD